MTKNKPHAIATYKDGFKRVRYCHVCSAEENELTENCPGHLLDASMKRLVSSGQMRYGFNGWEIVGDAHSVRK